MRRNDDNFRSSEIQSSIRRQFKTAGFEVLSVEGVLFNIFWDVIPHSTVQVHRCSRNILTPSLRPKSKSSKEPAKHR